MVLVPTDADLTALAGKVTALEARVTALENTTPSPPPPGATWYMDLNYVSTDTVAVVNATQQYYGQEVSTASSVLAGKNINTIAIWAKKVGNPTGAFTLGVFDSSIPPVQKMAFGTGDVSQIPTTPSKLSVKGGNYTLQVGDKICIKYTGGDASNNIQVFVSPDSFDTTNTRRVRYAGGWVAANAQDTRMSAGVT